jgi:hypothetical protein
MTATTTTARALLLVPPFIKYNSGPLLGPALLQSAARKHGYDCTVLDLNAHWIQPRVGIRTNGNTPSTQRGMFLGDHDKDSTELRRIEADFNQSILSSLDRSGEVVDSEDLSRQVNFGFLSHAEIESAAASLAASKLFGSWARERMLLHAKDVPPSVVGISLLHAGQVIPAVALSMLVRSIWSTGDGDDNTNTTRPLVVWGGPHVSGLGKRVLEADISERSFAADVFVTGHAEQTFVDILNRLESGEVRDFSSPVVMDGTSGGLVLRPTFENLALFDHPLVLPAQSTLGCAYGRCAYCTYPAIEPTPTRLDLTESVGAVAEMASQFDGASISMKDSLVTSNRLDAIGSCIGGRVKWAACTKLSYRLDYDLLLKLQTTGLGTLEVGLESLLEETQRRVSKIQPVSLYETFVKDVAAIPDLTLVVNYMVGFPWEKENEAADKMQIARSILQTHLGSDRAIVELNDFELERLAPMARFPEAFGIKRIKDAWPWASVLEFESS